MPLTVTAPSNTVCNPFRICTYGKNRGEGLGEGSAPTRCLGLQSVLFSPCASYRIHRDGMSVSREQTNSRQANTPTTGGGRQERRQCRGGEVHRHNTCGRGHPILRCLRGFPFSAT